MLKEIVFIVLLKINKTFKTLRKLLTNIFICFDIYQNRVNHWQAINSFLVNSLIISLFISQTSPNLSYERFQKNMNNNNKLNDLLKETLSKSSFKRIDWIKYLSFRCNSVDKILKILLFCTFLNYNENWFL
jgi:plasmid rolling circle replication initiator protein Rep